MLPLGFLILVSLKRLFQILLITHNKKIVPVFSIFPAGVFASILGSILLCRLDAKFRDSVSSVWMIYSIDLEGSSGQISTD